MPVFGPVSAAHQLGGLTESQFRHLKKKDDGADTETYRFAVRIQTRQPM